MTNRPNDSKATKDFWAKIRQDDRAADLRGEGLTEDEINEALRRPVAEWVRRALTNTLPPKVFR